jgi:hypothetical protein
MTTMAAPRTVLRVTEADIGRMRLQLCFEGPGKGRRPELVPGENVLLPGDGPR